MNSISRIITIIMAETKLKKRWCLEVFQADEEEVYRAVSGCLSAPVSR